MKVVILAGGYGSRLGEATITVPKPMVEIGGKPILWHIMKIYSYYGFNEFIICCGYKGYLIKEFFANYFIHNCNITIDLSKNNYQVLDNFSEPWKVTLVDTGLDTMTGGRISLISRYINEDTFLLTYGDGVGNIDIIQSIDFHKKLNSVLTLTTYQPEGRFGTIEYSNNGIVTSFQEKPLKSGTWINAGFFVCNHSLFDYLTGKNDEIFEKLPMEKIAINGKMGAYLHKGFWKPMDTMKDVNELNVMWNNNNAPWKIWKD